jgi:hypothetical protein
MLDALKSILRRLALIPTSFQHHGVSFATGFSAPAFDFSERRRRQRSFNAHFGIEMAEGKYSKTRKPHWAMP